MTNEAKEGMSKALESAGLVKPEPTDVDNDIVDKLTAALPWAERRSLEWVSGDIWSLAKRSVNLLGDHFIPQRKWLRLGSQRGFQEAMQDALVEAICENIKHFIPQVEPDDLTDDAKQLL